MKRVDLLLEPKVRTKEEESSYCKTALLSGPYGAGAEAHSNRVSLGIVGTYDLIEKAKEWINRCHEHIESRPLKSIEDPRHDRVHRLLFPDFPGCTVAFEKKFVVEPQFEQKIPLSELGGLDKSNKFAYIEKLLQILEAKIASIVGVGDRKPDVILVLLTNEMYETCHIVGDYHRRLRKKSLMDELQLDLFQDFDKFSHLPPKEPEKPLYRVLRSAIKKLAMNPKYEVPVQIILENTVRGQESQNLATRSWNLCTGLYYKSGDLPWIVSGLDNKTCFLGISFFHKKTYYSDLVYTSMAHLFSNDFSSIVLRGEKVPFDESLQAPALDRSKARSLVERGLAEYHSKRHVYPERLVIHKTSRYNEQEVRGFRDVLDEHKIAYDLVSLTKGSLRVIRWGNYPVPRGTLYVASDNQAHLYTKGFVPDLQTYPGTHIPSPFVVEKAWGDSSIGAICSEILALTKLNWNTADYCCGVPITIGFARSVGEVMKEFDEEVDFDPNRLFKFYM